MVNLSDPIYTDENKAREHLEKLQWPFGPVCPHCEAADNITRLNGKSTRPGLYKCNTCRKPFSVTVGTVFERSHIPLTKWLLATHLLTSSKKGISAHQIHRTLGVTYKTAWFMCHRIREAMTPARPEPLGGKGKIVEADETFYGTLPGKKKARAGAAHKITIVSLVERGGTLRSTKIGKFSPAKVKEVVLTNARRESTLMTDEASFYRKKRLGFAKHETVNHSIEEYVRGDAHVNTLEGYFSIFKRGMSGVYQHCGEQHLHRYLAEFDFRFNNRASLGVNDAMRAQEALKNIDGKRLTYRRTNGAANN